MNEPVSGIATPQSRPVPVRSSPSTGAPETGEPILVLRGGGVAVVVHLPDDGLPEVLHWGRDLGELTGADLAGLRSARARPVSPSALDDPWPLTLLPGEHDGWEGRPGFAAHRAGRIEHPRWTVAEAAAKPESLQVRAVAEGLALDIELVLDDAGVLRLHHELQNTAAGPLALTGLETVLPVGDRAGEVLDFTGRWTRERAPQRRPLAQGSHVRETRRGRTGHDAPFVLALGTPGFSTSTGEVWAVHLAWSGDAVYRHDALPEAKPLIGAGPLLRAGEIELAPGESFRTPAGVFVWSDTGTDGLGARLHRSLRSRAAHPRTPRPVVLNTWEAVYFQHDLGRLASLADTAASIGVERFVLDDGWFKGRRDDSAGLGDWTVDTGVWPEGLHPIADKVRSLGMQFGLWFEPEMVNPDSDLARAHPEWLLQPLDAGIRTWRGQYVLNVAHPDAFDYLLDAIGALVAEYRLDYIKWDQNRDLIEAVHDGRANVHRHTEAVYRLLDRLRADHPGLEIESCASGGARIDLGVLERTDRVWASDTNDPIERLAIQRWTELLLPLELIGSHIGPPVAHTTHRAASLDFRIATALFGHAGIEWDITSCTPSELEQLRAGINAYRRLRGLLHTGTLTHSETGDDGATATAVTNEDRSCAVVRLARHATASRALAPMLRVPGLDPNGRYRVAPVEELTVPRGLDDSPPPWLATGLVLPGSVLAEVGVQPPLLAPGEALVLELTRDA
ncbi:alpha-galactosidase [Glycomyces algeriensis]|uniref:alpha-galactosidase n=1 Tax=Glycomyces algeriensis TaxID=256037 RepID=A0A9W6G483_9ACTN|nr:alpha-galactosidase [Glycomyces algeriensis]MDA1367612.1 alpha-galactosidase [Glycomyces algeriensis]MDR7353025.1 alpha-galactosidase [Glycomyces algeriensis]GLI40715.1 alpha-galactosidase [Glycomyces algeriensis]